jgi:hypothetical protein
MNRSHYLAVFLIFLCCLGLALLAAHFLRPRPRHRLETDDMSMPCVPEAQQVFRNDNGTLRRLFVCSQEGIWAEIPVK